MNQQSNQITALYCRVDGGKYPPHALDAIQHQQEILLQYAREHDLPNPRIYADCGLSGNDFNRPEFQRMLREIEAGNVATLIVKDMSRLSRASFAAGVFIEKTLPRYGVTFHSLETPYFPVLPLYEAIVAKGGRA